MSLTEIKNAACELSPKELAELAAFISKQDNAAWDQQMEEDAASGSSIFFLRRLSVPLANCATGQRHE
jgi:cytochrome c553